MVWTANYHPTTDGVAFNMLSRIETSIPIVLVARANDFKFNEDLYRLDKYILVCFTEYGWQWNGTPHTWGVNSEQFDFLQGDEWKKFDEFVSKKPPILTFKRELIKGFVTYNTKPIEYPNWQPEIPVQPKDEYERRPISVFNFWGRSSEYRVKFHAEIWENSSIRGYSVCDNPYYLHSFLSEERGEKWVSLNIPHYARLPIESILQINGRSKLSVSMHGAGKKCFRSTGESPVNSCMFMQSDNLAWAYEWVNGVNCIKAKKELTDFTVGYLYRALDDPNLYDIYVKSVETANKYRIEPYINNYLLPIINEHS